MTALSITLVLLGAGLVEFSETLTAVKTEASQIGEVTTPMKVQFLRAEPALSDKMYSDWPPAGPWEKKYFYVEESIRLNWFDAYEYCAMRQSRLARVQSEDENDALIDQLMSQGISEKLWLGGNDLAEDGQWKWLLNGASIAPYDNWADGEPNNYEQPENCLVMGIYSYAGPNYIWNDLPCDEKHGFVCEAYVGRPDWGIDKQVQFLRAEPALSNKMYSDWPPAGPWKKTFFYVEESNRLNWFDAYEYCAKRQSRLARVQSEDEYNAVTDQLHSPDQFWLGGNDLAEEGQWKWLLYGETLGPYSNWRKGEPNNSNDRKQPENCLVIGIYKYYGQSYLWNDLGCQEKHGFVCEFYV